MTTNYTCPDGRVVTLHWNSWLARAAAGFGGINNCVTLTARHVCVSRDWITAKGLAHEVGHTVQARVHGWHYLPWVLWGYVRYGYEKSPAELHADAYMEQNVGKFPNFGPVPSWAT